MSSITQYHMVLIDLLSEFKRSPKLPVMTCYYVRQLLRQHVQNLKSIVAQGASVSVDPETDLDEVLESLYLEDDEIAENVLELQNKVCQHQIITAKNPAATEELGKIEREIFWILGLKLK